MRKMEFHNCDISIHYTSNSPESIRSPSSRSPRSSSAPNLPDLLRRIPGCPRMEFHNCRIRFNDYSNTPESYRRPAPGPSRRRSNRLSASAPYDANSPRRLPAPVPVVPDPPRKVEASDPNPGVPAHRPPVDNVSKSIKKEEI
nr:uncharacterized protein LOC108062232 [Drosophila takahashii]